LELKTVLGNELELKFNAPEPFKKTKNIISKFLLMICLTCVSIFVLKFKFRWINSSINQCWKHGWPVWELRACWDSEFLKIQVRVVVGPRPNQEGETWKPISYFVKFWIIFVITNVNNNQEKTLRLFLPLDNFLWKNLDRFCNNKYLKEHRINASIVLTYLWFVWNLH
jgi:hypothetical protein